jgi:hypothetical protein
MYWWNLTLHLKVFNLDLRCPIPEKKEQPVLVPSIRESVLQSVSSFQAKQRGLTTV